MCTAFLNHYSKLNYSKLNSRVFWMEIFLLFSHIYIYPFLVLTLTPFIFPTAIKVTPNPSRMSAMTDRSLDRIYLSILYYSHIKIIGVYLLILIFRYYYHKMAAIIADSCIFYYILLKTQFKFREQWPIK